MTNTRQAQVTGSRIDLTQPHILSSIYPNILEFNISITALTFGNCSFSCSGIIKPLLLHCVIILKLGQRNSS